MTRQIALGAVIAFAVTVLALSVWEPKAPAPAAPAPPPPAAAQAPAPAVVSPVITKRVQLMPDLIARPINKRPPLATPLDAGAPTP